MSSTLKLFKSVFRMFILGICTLAVFSSCQNDDDTGKLKVINYFSMKIGNEEWQPFQPEFDPCKSTFNGSFTQVNTLDDPIPIYTIYAYRDPNGIANVYSENRLRMQLRDIKEKSTITLDGSYKNPNDFESFITFTVSDSSGEKPTKRYVNDHERHPLIVNLDEVFLPKGTFYIPAIIGTFEGVIYNDNDLLDSMVITEGKFNILRTGENHCD